MGGRRRGASAAVVPGLVASKGRRCRVGGSVDLTWRFLDAGADAG